MPASVATTVPAARVTDSAMTWTGEVLSRERPLDANALRWARGCEVCVHGIGLFVWGGSVGVVRVPGGCRYRTLSVVCANHLHQSVCCRLEDKMIMPHSKEGPITRLSRAKSYGAKDRSRQQLSFSPSTAPTPTATHCLPDIDNRRPLTTLHARSHRHVPKFCAT